MTRTAPSGPALGPQECLTVEQAIRAQTFDAARQLFADDVTGSLPVGKYADLQGRATYLASRRVHDR